MNIRDFEYLVAVHDLLNFSKAAERCCVSQPTLSGQLKKLEDELGTPLVERSTRQVMFTSVGEQVVAHARHMLQLVEEIRLTARQSLDPMQGEFRIGLIPTVGPFLLPFVMPLLNTQFPSAQIYLYERQTDALIEGLMRGELDAVIAARLDWTHPVVEMSLYTESMKLAVPSSDSLATSTRPLNRSVLNGRPVLMLEDGHCLRGQALGVCFAAGAEEDRRFQATSLDTLLHMVASGIGITLVPALAAHNIPSNLRMLEFEAPEPSREVVMLVRRTTAKSAALEVIANTIKSAVSSVLKVAD